MNAPTTIEDMHQRIITAYANITSDVFVRVQHSFRLRLLLSYFRSYTFSLFVTLNNYSH
ncbi:hypothetical protein WH47_00820 [Habropoda laboriosa]|uniref:Uncharacterized protein n=1 Tax=Habropoda laboriosa TaxID=597456 RepID=A0A0L7QK63_9HYME|nr:hypothetical protein WH47_00820 [Habropoda laboriosa]